MGHPGNVGLPLVAGSPRTSINEYIFLTRIQGFAILRLQMQQYAIVVEHASSCDQIIGVKSTSPCRFTSAKIWKAANEYNNRGTEDNR